MKGVILAGGFGKRLSPLTDYISKLLLPVGKEPMLWHSIRQCVLAEIKDILIVTSARYIGEITRSVGSGHRFNCSITYKIQEEPKGIADALSLAEDFTRNEKFMVMLGDNVFEYALAPYAQGFRKQKQGAKILVKKVEEPERYGIAEIKRDKIISIVEKPDKPNSNYAVLGCYFYDKQVYSFIKQIKPSQRGELEITDVNNLYLASRELSFSKIRGRWVDAGTFSSLAEANSLMLENNNRICTESM